MDIENYIKKAVRDVIKKCYECEQLAVDVDALVQYYAYPLTDKLMADSNAEAIRIDVEDIPNYVGDWGEIWVTLAHYDRTHPTATIGGIRTELLVEIKDYIVSLHPENHKDEIEYPEGKNKAPLGFVAT